MFAEHFEIGHFRPTASNSEAAETYRRLRTGARRFETVLGGCNRSIFRTPLPTLCCVNATLRVCYVNRMCQCVSLVTGLWPLRVCMRAVRACRFLLRVSEVSQRSQGKEACLKHPKGSGFE